MSPRVFFADTCQTSFALFMSYICNMSQPIFMNETELVVALVQLTV